MLVTPFATTWVSMLFKQNFDLAYPSERCRMAQLALLLLYE